jgi:hypothetical protein
MGIRERRTSPLAWQNTLGEMRRYGTLLALCCARPKCKHWDPIDVGAMIATHGEAWAPWDHFPPCPRCRKPAHYMASPAESTPFRPLSSFASEIERQAWLKGFGFTRRDVARIRAAAERLAADLPQRYHIPASLNDLDTPYRVQPMPPHLEPRCNGQYLGEWAGMSLMVWRMTEPEMRVWRRRPKAVKGV